MRTRILWMHFIAGAVLSGTLTASVDQYEPVGPQTTALLEEELRERVPGYNCAFWPRQEKLANAVNGANLPQQYTDSIRKWLPRILKPTLMPPTLDPNTWLGVRKLYFGRNYIIGRFPPSTDPNTTIEFKAMHRLINITVLSESLFPNPPHEMTASVFQTVLTSILAIPSEKTTTLQIQSHLETFAGTEIYYGKIYNEWSETTSPLEGKRQWWSYIPFWYSQGRLFVSILTVEPGDLPDATMSERWPF